MATKLYDLAVKIQGGVDSAFGDSLSVAQKHLGNLDKQIKDITAGQQNVGSISESFVRLSRDAEEYQKQMGTLTRQQKNLSGYQAQKQATMESAVALREARNRARELAQQYQKSGLPEHARALKTAQSEATKLEKVYTKNKTALNKMGGELQKNGVNIKDVSGEYGLLSAAIAKSMAEQKKYNNALAGLAKVKYNIANVRALTKQLCTDIASGVKTFAKGAAVFGGGLYMIAKGTADQADAAAKLSSKLHMSAEGLQEFQYAAKLSGVSNFDNVIKSMNTNLARAVNGEGKAVKGIKELGISAKQLQKMGPEKSIMVLADRLNQIQDPAKKARIAFALWGEQGPEMLEMLKSGSKGLQALRDEARKTGSVIPNEVTKQAEAFKNAKDNMADSLRGLRNIFGAEMLPVFTEFFGEVSESLQGLQPDIRAFGKEMVTVIRDAIPTLKSFAGGLMYGAKIAWGVIQVLAKLVGGFGNLGVIVAALPFIKAGISLGRLALSLFQLGQSLGALPALLSPIKGALLGLLKPLMALALTPMGLMFMAITAAVAIAAYAIWENWDWIKETASKVVANVKGSWQGMVAWFKGIPEQISVALAGVTDVITNPFKTAFGWISDGWTNIKTAFKGSGTISAGASVAQNARGGRNSSRRLSTLAERGPEWVVPTASADRSHGLAALFGAARALNVPMPATASAGGGTLAPIFNIYGENPVEIANEVLRRLRDEFGAFMSEQQDRMERVRYGAV